MSKNSKNVSVSSNNNKGVSMKKSTLVINDLALEMSNLYWSDSFGMESTEFYSTEEYSIDTEDFLLNQASADNLEDQKKLELYAQSVIKALEIEVEDAEVAKLIAAQKIDLDQAGNAFLKSDDRNVYVTVQRLSDSGNWYNAKDSLGKIYYVFPVEAIFNMNENDQIESLKVNAEGKYCVLADMETMGFDDMFILNYTDKATTEKKVKFIQQRFVMSSTFFVDGVVVNDQKIHGVVAPFNYTVDPKTKEISEKRTSYAYENIIEVCPELCIVPSDIDMSQGEMDSLIFDQGIMTGTQTATNAMALDDMHKEEIAAAKKEEKTLNSIATKTKIAVEYKKASIASNYKDVLESDAGFVAAQLIEGSYSKDKKQLKVVFEAIENYADIEALHNAVVAHRVVNGKGLEYKAWTHLLQCKKNVVRREIANTIDKSVAENIAKLNKGTELKYFSDSQVVDMYEAALKYRKTNAAYSIDFKYYRDLQTRACSVKGVKSATEFVRNGKVTNVKVG